MTEIYGYESPASVDRCAECHGVIDQHGECDC